MVEIAQSDKVAAARGPRQTANCRERRRNRHGCRVAVRKYGPVTPKGYLLKAIVSKCREWPLCADLDFRFGSIAPIQDSQTGDRFLLTVQSERTVSVRSDSKQDSSTGSG